MSQQSDPASIPPLFEAAWNAHDMEAFGSLFHDDASFVNRFAVYWRGAEAIIAGHRHIHETIYRDSTLQIDPPDVDVISDDAAILHLRTRLSTGAAHPAGPHQVDTLILAVVTRKHGQWRIQAAENVTLTNPMTGKEILRER